MENSLKSIVTVATLMLAGAANANDTDGLYVGLSYGAMDVTADSGASASGNGAGIFIGYNSSVGDVAVYGAEIEAARIEDVTTVNLKGRLGYKLGERFTAFGILGLGNLSATGLNETETIYGLGADISVAPKVTLGLEGLSYNVDGGSINTVKARFSYGF